jgi:DNA-directed RNA polymerase specialized sigma24 family protein
MKSTPGTLQEGGAHFHTTDWTLILQAAESEGPADSQRALSDFCEAYWPPLYTFVRRRGYSPSDAQDLVQGFFAHLLKQNTLRRANRDKGKLRTFLLGSLEHFLANEYDWRRTLKRGGGKQLFSLEDQLAATEAALVSVTHLSDTASYDQAWLTTLVSRAWQHLERECAAEGKAQILQELAPYLRGGSLLPDQQEIAARLQVPFGTLRTILRRLRLRYREILREEVARTVSDSSQVDDELRYLHRLLLAGSI